MSSRAETNVGGSTETTNCRPEFTSRKSHRAEFFKNWTCIGRPEHTSGPEYCKNRTGFGGAEDRIESGDPANQNGTPRPDGATDE